MPIQTVDSDRLYRKIAHQLSELIAAGEFTPGQRLPAERELAHQLGVSRPSVREALIALEIEGKVEVRVGSGIFVARAGPTPVPAAVEAGEGPFELIRARLLVEGEVAAVAAREAAPADVAAIRAAVDDMRERHRRRQDPDPSDRAFHLAVAAATHNSTLVWVVQSLWDQGRGAMWKQMEKHFQTPELRLATIRDHAAVLAAIEAGDERAARTAMRRHLTRVDREFGHGWEKLKGRGQKAAAAKAAR